MKKLFYLFLIAAMPFSLSAQTAFLDQKAKISFFSSTPVEDIDAKSESGVGVLDVSSKSVYFKVPMRSFLFKKALMQEHFNENYVESDKFPHATFKGKINEDVDLTKDGTYNVTVTGDFIVHGVTQNRTIPGTIVVKGQTIEVTTAYEVKVADHDIEIPTIVVKNIAEVVQVKMYAMLTPAPDK